METITLTESLVRLIDQRKLPAELTYLECEHYREVAQAIKDMAVRGAPAIGVAAAFGLVQAVRQAVQRELPEAELVRCFQEAADTLAATRPTAVNLFWAIERMTAKLRSVRGKGGDRILKALEAEARSIQAEDVAMNRRIGEYGARLIKDGWGVLTHCNAGALATAGYGTALGVIRAAHESGKSIHVYVDETRPLLQGARLTAWEMVQEGIPATLITDNMAGHFMQRGKINFVVVGADRIAANGDVANKIGTYTVAVLAREHGIPFYVAAPSSTVDLKLKTGADIPIEERSPSEVTAWGGKAVAPEGIAVANPAFDVTPARLVTGIITDRGIIYPPYDVNLARAFGAAKEA